MRKMMKQSAVVLSVKMMRNYERTEVGVPDRREKDEQHQIH